MKRKVTHSADFIGHNIVTIAWSLAIGTLLLAVIAWGQTNAWQFIGVSTYRLFPLFGLVAFSLFWAQYVIAALSQHVGANPTGLIRFYGVTSALVFLALLLHPGLLSYQLWLDGYGLPPQSVLQHAVLPGFEWIVLLGMTSWVVFMTFLVTYKFHRIFQTKKWWVWFGYIGEVAMLAVFYHGFRLGDQLQEGWFRWVWIAYGIALVISLFYLHKDQMRR